MFSKRSHSHSRPRLLAKSHNGTGLCSPVMAAALFLLLTLSGPGRADLVGLWRFDADVDPQPDATGNGHDGDLQGDVKWVDDSVRGGVMEFDGEEDYLEVEDTDLLSIEGDLTIAAWVNFASFSNWNSIVSKTGDVETNKPAPYDMYTIFNDDGRPRIFLGNGSDSLQNVDAFDAPELEEWVHLAVTASEDGEVFHYLNGEENGDGFITADRIDLDTNLFIGSRADFVTNMFGRMDDVAIFNEVLSPEQINVIMTGDFSDFGIGGVGLEGDFNGDGMLSEEDLNLLTLAVVNANNPPELDITGDAKVDQADRVRWIKELKKTWVGDADLDGTFGTPDLLQVFQRGEYEDAVVGNSVWGDGDFNGDLDFNTTDLVVAFQDGGFEKGPIAATAAVPEPASMVLFLLGIGLLLCTGRPVGGHRP